MTYIPKPVGKSKDTVTLALKDWEAMIEALEDAEDRRTVEAFRAAGGKDEAVPLHCLYVGVCPCGTLCDHTSALTPICR